MNILARLGTPQCRNKLCNEGRRKCPTPQACQVPEPGADSMLYCVPANSPERAHSVILGGAVLLLAVVGLVSVLAAVL